MRVVTFMVLAVIPASVVAFRVPSSGWSPCPPNTIPFDDADADDDADVARRQRGAALPAECQVFSMPLCHPGICDSTETLPIFVKRITSPVATSALWVMDGGPGCSSVDMEIIMQDLFMDLNGTFSVYTMDHRGSGRSAKLTCDGDLGDEHDLAACVDHLYAQYGANAEAFSTTSAAKDLTYLSPAIDPEVDWYVYGVSYGSYLMARVLHLAHEFTFHGYVLDSIVPETLDVPNGDAAYGAVVARYLDALDKDVTDAETPLQDQLRIYYNDLDDGDTPECASWLQDVAGRAPNDPPSYAARRLFAALLEDSTLRTAFYPLLTLLQGCSDADVQVLETYVGPYLLENDLMEPNFTSDYDSLVLYYVILSSEHQLFYSPAPPLAHLIAYFTDQVVDNPVYRDFMAYCLFTNHRDQACRDQGYRSTKGFSYKPDAYFNRTAPVPTSLLVLNGGLDPITPDDQAKFQFEQYATPHKLFINVSDASHAVIDSPCGYDIIISYLTNHGNVSTVNTTCLAHLPPLALELAPALRQDMFGHQLLDANGDVTLSSGLGLASCALSSVPSALLLVASTAWLLIY